MNLSATLSKMARKGTVRITVTCMAHLGGYAHYPRGQFIVVAKARPGMDGAPNLIGQGSTLRTAVSECYHQFRKEHRS